jgi:hypothetical protein
VLGIWLFLFLPRVKLMETYFRNLFSVAQTSTFFVLGHCWGLNSGPEHARRALYPSPIPSPRSYILSMVCLWVCKVVLQPERSQLSLLQFLGWKQDLLWCLVLAPCMSHLRPQEDQGCAQAQVAVVTVGLPLNHALQVEYPLGSEKVQILEHFGFQIGMFDLCSL